MHPDTIHEGTPHSPPSAKRAGCCFIAGWITATMLGFVLSLLVFSIGERPDLGVWHGILGGGIIGLFQGLVLARYNLGGRWWFIANALAWGIAGMSSIGVVGWFAPSRLIGLPLRMIYGALEGLKIGIITGFVQWWVLKRTVATFPVAWITCNTLTWMVGLASGWAFGGVLRQMTNLFISEVVGLIVAWSIVSLISGVALSVLLGSADRQASNTHLIQP